MSILNQTVNKDKKLNLTICKRGGREEFKGGTIVAETEKAILVQFPTEGKEVWISKRNVYDNPDNYNVVAKLWVAWERVVMQDINTQTVK